MTRFKELRRIENAIKHKNIEELKWSLDYCTMRLGIVTMKEHKKDWNKLIKEIKKTINEINND